MASRLVVPSKLLAAFLGTDFGVALPRAEVYRRIETHLQPAPKTARVIRVKRPKDPDLAMIRSEGENFYYSVPSLRKGKMHADSPDSGLGACTSCGRPLAEVLRISSTQPPSHWKTHLPYSFSCSNCRMEYDVTYGDGVQDDRVGPGVIFREIDWKRRSELG